MSQLVFDLIQRNMLSCDLSRPLVTRVYIKTTFLLEINGVGGYFHQKTTDAPNYVL